MKKAKKTKLVKQPRTSKSDYVRALPNDLPAKEVVAKAAKEGIQLSVAQVYNIRSVARKKAGTSKPSPNRKVARKPTARRSSEPEAQLRLLIAEVGLAKARAILAGVEVSFAGG